ncbi:MAG: AAA family ATPase [Acidobacteriota bacterium]
MIARYFGMREDPFGATPDPRLLYASRTHREALASLRYSFLAHRGFVALIAEPGMGKTTLLFKFMEQVQASSHTAFLFNTRLGPEQLISSLLREIGISPGPSIVEMQEQLYSAVTANAREGRPLIVLLDEAQSLPEATLEAVRLLTNFETTRTKLIQVVLAGQPQLSETLSRPSLLQLRQRIGTICTLDRLSHAETCEYVQHRLQAVGYDGPPIFGDAALGRIATESKGIPRVINTLCFQTLSLCCALQRKSVDAAMVGEALRDLELPVPHRELQNEHPEPPRPLELLDLAKESRRVKKRIGWLMSVLAAFAASMGWGFYCASGVRAEKPATSIQQSSPPLAPPEAPHVSVDTRSGMSPLVVTVEAEQTLSGIAVSRLGYFNEDILLQIQSLNPDIVDPNLITPGQRIILPRRAEQVSSEASSKVMNERIQQ